MPNLVLWVLARLNLAKVVIGLVVFNVTMLLLFGVATLGIAILSSDLSDKNRINCSGVSWDTPYELKGVDYMERFGTFFKKMSDGKDGATDAVYLVRAVKDTVTLWMNAFTGKAFGDVRANKAVTGYRDADKRAREKALRHCCVQLRTFSKDGEEAPEPEPEPPVEKPWDPKQAAFQPRSARFNAEQKDIARISREVALRHRIPNAERAVIVSLAAGFQESGVVNLTWGDRDSIGWLQQRPSAGWGTPRQILNPELAAEAFYGVAGHTRNRGLVDVRGWQRMPVTRAVYAVQRSAYPNGAAQYEDDARALLAAIGGMGERVTPVAVKGRRPPVFDPSQPLSAYCAQLDASDGRAGVAPGSSGLKDEQGGGPVPAHFDRQGNPRTVEEAIAWITAAAPNGRGGERISNRCERWMNLAFGLSGGYGTANAHWYAPGPRSTSGVPPRGALVFWRTSNPAGHVGLSLGNGIVASTDYDAASGRFRSGVIGIGPISDIDRWGPRLGWRAPNFKVGSEGGVTV